MPGLTIPQKTLKYIQENAEKGNVVNVINKIDEFCSKYEQEAINVGVDKGKILDSIIKEANPTYVLELGAYCGYSALRIANMVSDNAKIFTIEFDPSNATVSREMFKFAGMENKIQLLEGSSSEVLKTIKQKIGIDSFDFVFIDHTKKLYKPDVILMEELGLLHNGTVVVADNCIFPGCPDYLEYVRNNPKYECTNYLSKLEYSEREDSMEKCVYKC